MHVFQLFRGSRIRAAIPWARSIHSCHCIVRIAGIVIGFDAFPASFWSANEEAREHSKKKKKWRTDGERNLRYRGWISSVLYHNLEGRSSDPSINSYLPFITRKAELKALELMKVKIPKVNARSRSSPLIQRKSLLYTFPCPFFFFFFSYLHPHSRKTREITTCVNFGTFHNSQVDFPQLTNILPAHSLTARPTNIDPILFTALGILISYHLVTLVSALFI